jgi:hypothetical protein
MHRLLHSSTLSAATSPPTSIQINCSFRHNPRQPKSTEGKNNNNKNKNKNPNGPSNLTMKQKMDHQLPIFFTHTTPINQNDAPLSKIVHSKDLS